MRGYYPDALDGETPEERAEIERRKADARIRKEREMRATNPHEDYGPRVVRRGIFHGPRDLLLEMG